VILGEYSGVFYSQGVLKIFPYISFKKRVQMKKKEKNDSPKRENREIIHHMTKILKRRRSRLCNRSFK